MEGTASEVRSIGAGEEALAIALERLLGDACGHPVWVAALRRTPSPFATLFPAEVVSVALRTGEEVRLFVKHLGSEQSDHPEKQRRDREVRVYEALLGGDGLPVVKYYGSRRNEVTKRCEVFLEYVDDWCLKYHDLEQWFTAARRLAQFHAHFAARVDRLLVCDFLLRFDGRYLAEWVDRACAAVTAQSAALAGELAGVVSGYDRVIEVLDRQPLTLVHNDLSPKNILADRSSRPGRICFVDWEMAGVGCGLMDLVQLKYGLDPADDQKMCDTYCEALAETGLLPTDHRELRHLFAACELHQTVYRLAFAGAWRVPVERVAQWVEEARLFMGRI